jgi:FkbM family methyltransferase
LRVLQPENIFLRFLLGTRYVRAIGKKIISEYITTVPGGIRFRVRSADASEAYMIEEIFYKKIYERYYEAKKGDFVLDVGANLGAFSVKSSRLVGENGRVVAVEPESTNFRLLRANIRLNGCNNIIPIKTALGERPGRVSLNVYKWRGNNSFIARPKDSPEREEEVDVMKLDELAVKYNLSRLSLIKVDTEGYELKVLEGGEKTIRSFKPNIVGEAHPSFSDSASVILRYLDALGYDGTILEQPAEDEEMFYAWPKAS